MQGVHVILPQDRHLYEHELDQQHQIRADVFIRERRWSALRAVDGREHDQFDTDTTIYVLAIEPDRGVVGGCRLHPSNGPTLLSDVFPHLADVRGFERSPEILEWTRLYCIPERREDRPCRTIGAIKIAILEHCLASGITGINGVGETWFLPSLIRLGWKPRPLGLEVEHEGMTLFAFHSPITQQTLAMTRAHYGIDEPVALSRGKPVVERAQLRAVA